MLLMLQFNAIKKINCYLQSCKDAARQMADASHFPQRERESLMAATPPSAWPLNTLTS